MSIGASNSFDRKIVLISISQWKLKLQYYTQWIFFCPPPLTPWGRGDYWIRHRPSFRPSVHQNNLNSFSWNKSGYVAWTQNVWVSSYAHSCPCLLHEKHYYIIKAGDYRATRTLVLYRYMVRYCHTPDRQGAYSPVQRKNMPFVSCVFLAVAGSKPVFENPSPIQLIASWLLRLFTFHITW